MRSSGAGGGREWQVMHGAQASHRVVAVVEAAICEPSVLFVGVGMGPLARARARGGEGRGTGGEICIVSATISCDALQTNTWKCRARPRPATPPGLGARTLVVRDAPTVRRATAKGGPGRGPRRRKCDAPRQTNDGPCQFATHPDAQRGRRQTPSAEVATHRAASTNRSRDSRFARRGKRMAWREQAGEALAVGRAGGCWSDGEGEAGGGGDVGGEREQGGHV